MPLCFSKRCSRGTSQHTVPIQAVALPRHSLCNKVTHGVCSITQAAISEGSL